ncbi:MAG: hypothetical protein JSS73_13975 [Bacteroidetes bacterium]|nr:hypothetical protein [Bacteroidota bacterium]
MKKLVILHFGPLEWYPPVQNVVQVLAGEPFFDRIVVITTHSQSYLPLFSLSSERVVIHRLGYSGGRMNKLKRLFYYGWFYLVSLWLLLKTRPAQVLYFETLSSWPAYIYKRFFFRNCRIFIHYHEYVTPQEYNRGMKLLSYFHRLEQWLYPQAVWVSHTNTDRMNFFKQDIAPVKIGQSNILPNYPPKSWLSPPRETGRPLKFVYVGALSLDTMFTREFARWVVRWKDQVQWDIYSYNKSADIDGYFRQLNAVNISLLPGVSYQSLPAILIKYDVGVILYNGHIANYVYNVPNKLFEYVACGLDVWFPQQLVSTLPYQTQSSYPQIIPLDFLSLDEIDPQKLSNRQGLSSRQDYYFCEEAIKPLIQKLISA